MMNEKTMCEYGAKLCEAQIIMLKADGAKAENKQRELLNQPMIYGMAFLEELAVEMSKISEALRSLVSDVKENKEVDMREIMLEDQNVVFCGDCKKRIDSLKDFRFKLDPPTPISNWDKERDEDRYTCLFCCGKIRMRDQEGNLIEYDLPEGVKLVEEDNE